MKDTTSEGKSKKGTENDGSAEHASALIERRGFLKGAVAVGAAAFGAASMGVLGACSPKAAETNAPPAGPPSQSASGPDVNDAAQALKKWNFEIAPEAIPDSNIAETIEADVVVIGAGISGLVTANSAADKGLKVHVVSASKAPVSRGGSNNAVYSKAMEKLGLPRTQPHQILKEVFYGSNNMDTKKWHKFYNNSEEAMNWAIDLMEAGGFECGIEPTTPIDPDSIWAIPASSHGWLSKDVRAPAMGQPFFANRLAERLVELGGEVYYQNIGKQLVRGDVPNGTTGRVVAVIAQREDGSYVKYIGTRAVVLATGDFSANRDMMAKYCPEFAAAVPDEVYDRDTDYDMGFQYGGLYKGEGHQMGIWVGAAWQKVFPNCAMGNWIMSPGPTLAYGSHWGLLVDRHGERFMDEYCVNPVAEKTGSLQEGREVAAIWDTAYASYVRGPGLGLQGPPIGEEPPLPSPEETVALWDKQVENGMFVKADTLEGVIEQLELPSSTITTIERYNEFARNGADLDFHKRPDYLFEIKEGPFYGQTTKGTKGMILTVLGGLRSNSNMQVCDEKDDPIPGLYSVGTMIGDVFAGNYSYMVCGANYGMNCITLSYLTGKYIAENE
jgi:succinate dehydrogenase/fumarate reductase flavoprotein subunit